MTRPVPGGTTTTPVYLGLGVGAWFGLCLVVGTMAIAMQVSSFRYTADLFTPEAGASLGFSSVQAAIVAAGVVFLPLLSLSGTGPTFGRLRSAPRRLSRWTIDTTVAAITAAAVMSLLGTAVPRIAAQLPESWTRGTAGAQWQAAPAAEQWLSSLSAGILEEFAYVAAPLAAWAGTVALLDRLRRRFGARPISRRTYRAGLIAIGVLCIAARFNLHTYQGLLPAVAAVVWSAVNYVLYLRCRSLLALIVAHTFYDGAVAGTITLGTTASAPWFALAFAVAGGLYLTLRGRGRRAEANRFAPTS